MKMVKEIYFPSYEEAIEKINLENKTEDERMKMAEDEKAVFSSLLINIIHNSPLIVRLALGDLTGLDLETNEKLYEYLGSNIELDKEKAFKYSLVSVLQYEHETGKEGTLERTLNDMFRGSAQ